MGAAHSITAKAAEVLGQCGEGMFHRRLTNLFEPLGIVSSSAHSIEVLRDDGVIVIRQRKPIEVHLSFITRVCSYREADLRSHGIAKLRQTGEVPDDDIGSRLRPNRWHRDRLWRAIDNPEDFTRLHCHSNGDFPNH